MKKISLIMVMFMMLSGCRTDKKAQFLKTRGQKIVNENGQEVLLFGTNLGNWLLVEPWMLKMAGQPGVKAGKDIFVKLEKRFGKDPGAELYKTYIDNFITRDDIEYISKTGMNFIRVPFWYAAVFDPKYAGKEFLYLDRVIKWAKEFNIYCLIDMHGAPGGQNDGVNILGENVSNKLWFSDKYKSLTVKMWERIAERYKDEPAVAGYDLLNEAWGAPSMSALIEFYDTLYKKIRRIDKRHIIFIEDALQGIQRLPHPKTMGWENIVYSFHFYPDVSSMKRMADAYAEYLPNVRRCQMYFDVPFHIGEFNSMSLDKGGLDFMRRYIEVFGRYHWSWNFWSYKKIEDNHDYRWGLVGFVDENKPVNLDKISFEETKNLFLSYNTKKLQKDLVFEAVMRNYSQNISRYINSNRIEDDLILYPEEAMPVRADQGNLGIEWGFRNANFGFWGDEDAAVWKVNIPEAGNYRVIIDYASGAKSPVVVLSVDHIEYSDFTIKSTGSWEHYIKALFGTIKLSAGKHILKIKTRRSNEGVMNLRNVRLVRTGASGELLKPSADEILLDAITVSGVDRKSAGICVEWQNSPGNIGYWHDGESVSWKVVLDADCTYKLSMLFASPKSGSRMQVFINGKNINEIKLPRTGAWHAYKKVDLGQAEFKKGANEITLKGLTHSSEGLGNVQSVKLFDRGSI